MTHATWPAPTPTTRILRGWSVALLLGVGTACGPSGGGAADNGETPPSRSPEREPAALSGESQERLPPPGQAWVIFGSDTVRAELARTPQEREKGLMYREDLPGGKGMLFVFPDSQVRSFWMQNTLIPLDIAYLDEALTVVDIQTMEPETLDLHESARPAMFALEVPAGWFSEKGIGVGDTARVVFGPG